MFSSCYSVVKSEPQDNKIRYRKIKGDFNINISAKFEKLVLNSCTGGNIKLYVRFINKITPNNPQKLKRVVKINVGKAKPIGESYFVRIAKAPKSEALNDEETIRLKFGELVIQPVNRLSTEFNAKDQYGKGSFEFWQKLL